MASLFLNFVRYALFILLCNKDAEAINIWPVRCHPGSLSEILAVGRLKTCMLFKLLESFKCYACFGLSGSAVMSGGDL